MHKSIATFIEKWSHAISNQFTTSDPERAARGIILITFQAIAILTLLLFGSGLLLHRQHISLVIIDFAGAAILIGNIIYFHLTRNIRQSSYIALIAGIMLLMVLALSSTSDGSGIYWSFIFPLLAIALLGSVSGAFFSLGYLTFLNLFLWLPVSLFPHFHLETLPRIRIIAVFGFIFIISILLERIRVFAQKSQVTWQKSLLNHMDNLPIGIYRGSASAGILHVNTTLAHMLGFKTPDSFFENPTSFEPAFMNKSYKEIIDSQGLLHGLERPWITPSGETIHLKEHIRTLVDNGVTTFEGTVENITERRTMEDRMSTYLYDLTVLSTSVLQFTDISDISKAYPTIINQLTALIGDAIILASSYNARKQVFQIEDFYIPETLKQNNNNLSECNPKQTPFLMHEHVLTTLRTGQLTPLQYRSHDFFSHNMSAPQQEHIKALFDIGEVRLLGFSWQEEIFGNLLIINPKSTPLSREKIEIIETFGRQITTVLKREEALAEARMQSELTDSSQDAIIVADCTGHILYVNNSACSDMRYSRAELLTMNISDLKDASVNISFSHRIQALDSENVNSFESIHRRKDGTVFPVEIHIKKIMYRQIPALLGIWRNILERKQLQKLQEERLEAMEIAKNKAEESIKAKSEFLAIMSHEIKTPLTSILSMSELLKLSSLSGEQKEYSNLLSDSAERLLMLLNNIIDCARAESHELSILHIPFNPRETIAQSARLFEAPMTQSNIEFKVQISETFPELILGDALRFSQILSNLISNACKFTKKGSVSVIANHDKRLSSLSICIRDTGIGIPQEKMSHLFKPFSQVDSSVHRAYGGAGLGLSISQSLARRMGGNISVLSENSVGSSFTFTMPYTIA